MLRKCYILLYEYSILLESNRNQVWLDWSQIKGTYGTFMRFLPGVSSHMNNQHVLSFEWFFVPRAANPTTDESLLTCMDMVCVYMFHQIILCGKLQFAVHLENRITKILEFVVEKYYKQYKHYLKFLRVVPFANGYSK